MRRVRSLLLRIGGLFGAARRDRELAAVLEAHLQLHVDDGIRAGLTPAGCWPPWRWLRVWLPARRATRVDPMVALRTNDVWTV